MATLSGAGALSVTGPLSASSGAITNDLTVGGNLSVVGTLSSTAFSPVKYWVGIYVTTSGGVASIASSCGYSSVAISHVTGSLYTITFPAHPNGSNYLPMVQAQASTSANGGKIYFATSNIDASTPTTKCQVHLRADFTSGTLQDGNLFFHTVP